jgi:ribosome maturation factor RimP
LKGILIPFFHKKNLSLKTEIERIVTEELEQTEYFLVGFRSNESETHFQIYIDGPKGVGIDVCSKFSRKLINQLEEDERNKDLLKLEVSSPGADKPLVDKRQYSQHLGRQLSVVTTKDPEKELIGKLHEIHEDDISLAVPKDKKKKETEIITLGFDQIKKAQVQISFK